MGDVLLQFLMMMHPSLIRCSCIVSLARQTGPGCLMPCSTAGCSISSPGVRRRAQEVGGRWMREGVLLPTGELVVGGGRVDNCCAWLSSLEKAEKQRRGFWWRGS